MDPLGKPILGRNAKGQLIDNEGKLVNEKGYLIDKDGNIIDINGNKVFDKAILNAEGEIPKVFLTGLLRSDSVNSFMSDIIDRDQHSDFEYEEQRI